MNGEKVTQLVEAISDLICKLPISEIRRLDKEIGLVLECSESLDKENK